MSYMASTTTVRLLEIEPGIARFLTDAEQEAARGLVVPVRTVNRGTDDIAPKLGQAGAFAAIVLDGLLLQTLRLGERTAIRLLGPGDVVSAPGGPELATLDESPVKAAAPTRLAMLGSEVLAASRRWPLLVPGLHVQFSRQAERLAAQLVICQIPRVEDRLMALMWLLAESWGRVTLAGTLLPVRLTHGTLGALIGARRPTVTLALGELTKRGAIVNQDQGWLLVEEPPSPSKAISEVRLPALAPDAGLAATGQPRFTSFEEVSAAWAELNAMMLEMARRYQEDRERFRARLRLLETERKQLSSKRQRIRRDRLSHQRPPSS